MACTKQTVRDNGLNIWSEEGAGRPVPEVDIVAVQGLGSHPFYTWVKRKPLVDLEKSGGFRNRAQFWKGEKPVQLNNPAEDGSTEIMWIRDLLVPEFKNARIATYSYKSDWRDRGVETNLHTCATLFLNELFQHRLQENERRRPIVLIGHSLGCIVIQKALFLASAHTQFPDIGLSVAGIIFLGAPLQGSKMANLGGWLARALRHDTNLLNLLEKNSEPLYHCAVDFANCKLNWDLVCFYETQNTNFGLLGTRTVNQQSATQPGKRMIPLDADHSGLNKFSGENDSNFGLVIPEIRRMVGSSISTVAKRYAAINKNGNTEGNVHWTVPRAVNSLFTGRVELLLRIKNTLRDRRTCLYKQNRFIITGLGGQGKSEICLQVANLLKNDFWGVFWVDVNMISTAKRDFMTIANILGVSAKSVSEAIQVLATTQRTWLLILDNADNPKFDYQIYFPPGNHGVVLMTSRIPDCRRYSPDAFEALEGLELQDSKELLLKAAELPPELWASHDAQSEAVIELLGSHTLAIIQAGAYISQGHCDLQKYPEVFKKQRRRLLKFRPGQAQSRYGDIYTTFEASADILEQSDRESAKDALCLLEILSMLGYNILTLQVFEEAWKGSKGNLLEERDWNREIDDFSRDHASKLPAFLETSNDTWDSFRLTKAISLLNSLSLVSIQKYNNRRLGLSMHPLAHSWAKDRQEPEQQHASWIKAGCILGFSHSNDYMWKTQAKFLLPHISSYLDIEIKNAFKFGPKYFIIPILLKCSMALLDMRQDSILDQLLKQLRIELRLNFRHLIVIWTPLYYLQAKSWMNLGMEGKAESLLKAVVRMFSAGRTENDPIRLNSQYVLAKAYMERGCTLSAIPLLEQIIELYKTQTETHPNLLDLQHELAFARAVQSEGIEAVASLEKVVEIEGTTLVKNPLSRLSSQLALAKAYRNIGRGSEALALFEQVVEGYATMLAEAHPDRLESQFELSRECFSNKQRDKAVSLIEHIIDKAAATLPETHPLRLKFEEQRNYYEMMLNPKEGFF